VPKDPIVLLSRPMEQSVRFREALGDMRTIISPIMEIRPVPAEVDLSGYDVLLFASRHAVQAVRRFAPEGKYAIAVGQATAGAARELGMDVTAAGGDAGALVKLAAQSPRGSRMLFLRGRHSRGDVAQKLAEKGFSVDSVVVYDQVEKPLNPEAEGLLRGNARVIVPLFSPRSSALMGREARRVDASAPIVLVGLSGAVAQAWEGPGPLATYVAARPDEAEMVQKIRAAASNWP